MAARGYSSRSYALLLVLFLAGDDLRHTYAAAPALIALSNYSYVSITQTGACNSLLRTVMLHNNLIYGSLKKRDVIDSRNCSTYRHDDEQSQGNIACMKRNTSH